MTTDRLAAWGARALVLAGLVVMIAAGWRAGRYTAFFDPQLPWLARGLCDDAANAAGLLAQALAVGVLAAVITARTEASGRRTAV